MAVFMMQDTRHNIRAERWLFLARGFAAQNLGGIVAV